MDAKTFLLTGLTALSLAAPMASRADPEGWGGGDRGYRSERGDGGAWRANDRGDGRGQNREGWRGDGDRRDYARRQGWGSPYRWGYQRRCWVEERGYYEPDGDYISNPIRVCR